METVKDKIKSVFQTLKGSLDFTNPMQATKLEKIVVSVGTGRVQKDKNKMKLIEERLARITGQKPIKRPAKKSVASFKLREGDIIGYQVTLRGDSMYNFIDKLINISFPRTRDFRGIDQKSIDDVGNLTIGVPEHIIFPETSDEEATNVFGLSVVLVTTAKDKKTSLEFLKHIGLPFKKQ